MGRTNSPVDLRYRKKRETNARPWLQPNEVLDRLHTADRRDTGKFYVNEHRDDDDDDRGPLDAEIFVCAECDAAFPLNEAREHGDDLVCGACAGEGE